MSLEPGVRLGPYQVVSALGHGGMGEIYKARDTRLDRTVAIKVLPDEFAADPQARERFEREARAVAALNHPHICTLHDIGRHEPAGLAGGAFDFLVLELVEGDTLAERLARGALPLERAVAYAGEIASALDRAHQAGIVHRDIKPTNVMVTKSGIKLLDFGLAKLKGRGAPVSMSGIEGRSTAIDTASGTILGTVPYMAPEQVEGREADPRSDIWALGVVLYEMVTGTRPFEGDTPASIIGAILKDTPPPLTERLHVVPRALDHVVETCLAKAPEDRWQSARDLQHALRQAMLPAPTPTSAARPIRARAMALAALLVVAAGSLAAGRLLAPRPPEPPLSILDIVPPPETTLLTTAASIPAAQFEVSPDGRHVAFVAAGSDGLPYLWLRPMAGGVSERLSGTAGASYPFWSGDSQSLAYFAAGRLWRLDLADRSPRALCDATDARGGSWNGRGDIIFALGRGAVLRVSAGGGAPVTATTLDASREEVAHRWPAFLPDGQRFLYVARGPRPALRIASLAGDLSTILPVETIFSGVITEDGYLLYVRDRALVAQPFDLDRNALEGDAVTVVPRVGTSSTGDSAFSVSSTGVLAFAVDLTSPGQLTWFDRDGRMAGTVGPLADHMDFELSPDGRRLLLTRVDPATASSDVWLMDLERGTEARVTTHPGIDAQPLWDPSGARLVFRSNRNGLADVWIRDIGGADSERLLFKGNAANPTAWSSDGDRILFNESISETGWDIGQFSFSRNEKVPFLETKSNELHARLSPDGRWVAYSSDESGQWQVYVRPVSGSGERIVLSTSGGFEPRWRGDGGEIYYLTPERQIAAVEIRPGPRVEAARPRVLFTARVDPLPVPLVVANGYRKTYTVAPEGTRFLVNVQAREQNTQAINVMLNWRTRLHAAR